MKTEVYSALCLFCLAEVECDEKMCLDDWHGLGAYSLTSC